MVHSLTSKSRFLGTWDELAVDFFTLATLLSTHFFTFLFLNVKPDLAQITCTEVLPPGVINFLVTSRGEAYLCVRRQIDIAYMLRVRRGDLGPFLIFFLLIM